MKDKKICVYTCITGDYDNLQELQEIEKMDYYCFTNNYNIKSNTWKVIYIEDSKLSNIQLARKIKILGHPIVNEYDIAVWIDGSIRFDRSIIEFITEYLREEDVFSAFKHSSRNNIKEECYECIRMRKETKNNIRRILSFYEKENYDFNNGLIESGVYIKRPKNEKVIETMNLWFQMILKYSHRDQLSFNYCISKTKMPVHWINLKIFDNDWFSCNLHSNEKNISSYRVYFDDNKEYNIDYDFSDKFECKNGKYYINLKVPHTSEKTVVELSKIPYIELNSIKVNNIKKLKIHYFNSQRIGDKVIFLNENPAFEIYNKLKKDTELRIELKMNILKERDVINRLYNYLLSLEENNIRLQEVNDNYQSEIRHVKEENKYISNQIDEIKNRKIWKLINYYDKIHK